MQPLFLGVEKREIYWGYQKLGAPKRGPHGVIAQSEEVHHLTVLAISKRCNEDLEIVKVIEN